MSDAPEKIKERLSISDVLGSYIKLEKAGINYKAKCPFHNEKTPSFFVSPGRANFYCFGCGVKGDIFTFVEKFEGLDFKGALKLLAERAGISLDEFHENPALDKEKREIYQALEETTLFFEDELKKNIEAKAYLQKRGLLPKTMKEWRIGYASAEWRALKDHLTSVGIKEDIQIKAGLIKKSEKAKDAYDVFRGRIIFPIFDTAGRVIAFSGRILIADDKSPKYLNSPDTVVFNKSLTLYGLHNAKVPIRKRDYSILVEGQMDLLMCHQAGFDHAVATSGTALTSEHIKRLKSLSTKILMVFDGDSAGFKASDRGAKLALALGLEVKLGMLPEGIDPADLIAQDLKHWKEVLSKSKHIVDFHLEHLLREKLPARRFAKELEVRVLPFIRELGSEIEKSHFVKKIVDITGLNENAIWDEIKKVSEKVEPVAVSARQNQSLKVYKSTTSNNGRGIFRTVLAVLITEKEKKSQYGEKLEELLKTLISEKRLNELIAAVSEDKDELLFEAEKTYPKGLDETTHKELVETIQNAFVKEELARVTREIRKAEAESDLKKVEELLIIYSRLMKQKG